VADPKPDGFAKSTLTKVPLSMQSGTPAELEFEPVIAYTGRGEPERRLPELDVATAEPAH
jgi:hypothetical protein